MPSFKQLLTKSKQRSSQKALSPGHIFLTKSSASFEPLPMGLLPAHYPPMPTTSSSAVTRVPQAN